MKLLVTGASGFIGSHVCRDGLARGFEIRAVKQPGSDCRRLPERLPEIEWVECDLLTAPAAALDRIGVDVDACIHAAWYVVPGQYLTSSANDDYRAATLRLCSALSRQGCREITGLGTCFEYEQGPSPLDESAPVLPLTPYARAKLATFLEAEALLRGSGTALAWARLFYLYGPWEDDRRLVPDVALRLLRGQRAAVTSGRQVRDFLHVADAAGALVAVVVSGLRGAVNIGSSETVTVHDVVRAIGEITGRPDLIDFGARADNMMDPPFVCANNRRLREETGWHQRYGLIDGLRQTIEWWKSRA